MNRLSAGRVRAVRNTMHFEGCVNQDLFTDNLRGIPYHRPTSTKFKKQNIILTCKNCQARKRSASSSGGSSLMQWPRQPACSVRAKFLPSLEAKLGRSQSRRSRLGGQMLPNLFRPEKLWAEMECPERHVTRSDLTTLPHSKIYRNSKFKSPCCVIQQPKCRLLLDPIMIPHKILVSSRLL